MCLTLETAPIKEGQRLSQLSSSSECLNSSSQKRGRWKRGT